MDFDRTGVGSEGRGFGCQEKGCTGLGAVASGLGGNGLTALPLFDASDSRARRAPEGRGRSSVGKRVVGPGAVHAI